jgi:hypothetical protein
MSKAFPSAAATAAILLLLSFLAAGCGYRNLTRHRDHPPVYFPVMSNKTMEPAAELTLTNNIREELLRAGIDLARQGETGWLLEGVIVSYDRVPLSFLRQEEDRRWRRVHQYRLTVQTRMTLRYLPDEEHAETARERVRGFTETFTYYLEGPHSKTESEAFTILSANLAKRTVEWLTDF